MFDRDPKKILAVIAGIGFVFYVIWVVITYV
jgi:hypothetical protein